MTREEIIKLECLDSLVNKEERLEKIEQILMSASELRPMPSMSAIHPNDAREWKWANGHNRWVSVISFPDGALYFMWKMGDVGGGGGIQPPNCISQDEPTCQVEDVIEKIKMVLGG